MGLGRQPREQEEGGEQERPRDRGTKKGHPALRLLRGRKMEGAVARSPEGSTYVIWRRRVSTGQWGRYFTVCGAIFGVSAREAGVGVY